MDESSTDAASIEGVVRSYLASFAGRDPDAIAAHVSEDFVNEHTAALGEGCVGRSEYRARLRGFLADMHDLRYEIEELVIDGDRCVAAYTMTARWRGERPISVRGVQRLVVSDGTIVARTDYWDAAGFLVQAEPEAAAALEPFGIRSS